MKRLLSIILFLSLIINTLAAREVAEIEKETIIFSIQGNDTLRLDKYDFPTPSLKSKPCVIFVFGGGFASGKRDDHLNTEFMKSLARKGYVGIAIDYRLGMKNARNTKNATPAVYADMLSGSIAMAVEDLFNATAFIYQHAEKWNIHKEQIVACGSSAGAITVLQAEYIICNTPEYVQALPAGFNYGGIIAFAGAIFCTDKFVWRKKPAPILLFHGDADRNVPFNKVEAFGWGTYGSKYIAETLESIQSPYCFYEIENAAHEVSSDPMKYDKEEIAIFIDKFVLNKQFLMIHSKVKQPGKSEIRKEFTMEEYLGTNYR